MSHLTLETIARIVDEAPSAEEAVHLDACAVCRGELEAMREDVQSLSMLPDMAPPPDSWTELEGRLEAEGLIVRRHRFVSFPRLAYAAAALVLFLAGSIAGRLLVTPSVQVVQAPTPADNETVRTPVTAGPQVAAQTEPTEREPAPQTEPPRQAADPVDTPVDTPVVTPRAAPGVTLASQVFGNAGQPRTLEEAATLLRQTEELYLIALTRYAELATQAEPGDPVSRLAALQSIVMTTQAALSQAPADPVINGYHLTALAQRDATLLQVAAASDDRWY